MRDYTRMMEKRELMLQFIKLGIRTNKDNDRFIYRMAVEIGRIGLNYLSMRDETTEYDYDETVRVLRHNKI